MADALDLGSSVERRASSSLALGTNFKDEEENIRDKVVSFYSNLYLKNKQIQNINENRTN